MKIIFGSFRTLEYTKEHGERLQPCNLHYLATKAQSKEVAQSFEPRRQEGTEGHSEYESLLSMISVRPDSRFKDLVLYGKSL